MKFCCVLKGLGSDTGKAEFALESAGLGCHKAQIMGRYRGLYPQWEEWRGTGGHVVKLPSWDEGIEAPRHLVTCWRSLQ